MKIIFKSMLLFLLILSDAKGERYIDFPEYVSGPERVLSLLGGEKFMLGTFKTVFPSVPDDELVGWKIKSVSSDYFDGIPFQILTIEYEHHLKSGQMALKTITSIAVRDGVMTRRLFERTFQRECQGSIFEFRVKRLSPVRKFDKSVDMRVLLGLNITEITPGCLDVGDKTKRRLVVLDPTRNFSKIMDEIIYEFDSSTGIMLDASIDFDSGDWGEYSRGKVVSCRNRIPLTPEKRANEQNCVVYRWNEKGDAIIPLKVADLWE